MTALFVGLVSFMLIGGGIIAWILMDVYKKGKKR